MQKAGKWMDELAESKKAYANPSVPQTREGHRGTQLPAASLSREPEAGTDCVWFGGNN